MYERELRALEKSGRLREREIFSNKLIDFASNDYLGLAHRDDLMRAAAAKLESFGAKAPKASMLMNGYHPIHKELEYRLSRANGFEDGVVLGSGFLANISLIEALLRKGEHLFIDELYHASGVLATRLFPKQVTFFKHNNMEALESLLKKSDAKRNIVAVEGIYSMEGDMVAKEIFSVANRYEALLIVDEAHSNGVVGNNLLGVLDYYEIEPKKNHIKMGTLGKAYGSYGAYILASKEIISFLINRAKPIIYSTALSIFDTALALESFDYIQKSKTRLRESILERQKLVKRISKRDIAGLIISIDVESNKKAQQVQKKLIDDGYLIGAIRQPTVSTPILRVIARLNVDIEELQIVLKSIL